MERVGKRLERNELTGGIGRVERSQREAGSFGKGEKRMPRGRRRRVTREAGRGEERVGWEAWQTLLLTSCADRIIEEGRY